MLIVLRALGGRRARKLRAVLPERGLKAEKTVFTDVMYLVSMLAKGYAHFYRQGKSIVLLQLP